MHENTCGRVTFLVNLMFDRLDKFDGLIFRGLIYGGGEAYIIYDDIWGGAYIRGCINWILQYTIT